MIELKNISLKYENGTNALHDINLSIKSGEMAYIVGASGAGKSSILKLMLREKVATKGKIIVNGYDLGSLKRKDIPYFRRTIGFVFQDFRLIPTMNIYDNVAFAMRAVGASNKQIRARVPYVLELMDLLPKAKRYPHELSGGEQQRVAVARALVNDPPLIIADEPTGNIDPELSYEVVELLTQINKCGTTVLMVTHEHDMVKYFGGRIIEIEGGKVVFDRVIKGERDTFRERELEQEKRRKELQAHNMDKTIEVDPASLKSEKGGTAQ